MRNAEGQQPQPDPHSPFRIPHSAFRTFFSSLLNLFFPGRCRLCGEPLEEIARVPVCRACWELVEPLAAERQCDVCGLPLPGGPATSRMAPLAATPAAAGQAALNLRCGECVRDAPAFDRARSYGAYTGPLRELVHLFKYQGLTPLARPLGAWLAQVAATERSAGFADCDAVVAMPLDEARRRARGYNQAELLARVVARRLGRPLVREACRRIRATAPQAGLTRTERLANVRGAFAATESLVADRTLLLVDDVMTTGATLNACARALRQAGAKRVMALTVARTVEPLDRVTENASG